MSQLQKLFLFEQRKNTLVVEPQGDSVGFRSADVDKEMQQLHTLLDQDDIQNILFDLGQANYFGSSMIGMIVALSRKVEDAGGDAAVCNVSDQMAQMIEIMQLDQFLERYGSRKEGLKSIGK